MTERLFEGKNPNAKILEVEQQEGGTDDDNYFGSIGDATAKHVHNLGSNRQLWEDLIRMPSGSIYRMVPNWEDNDHDPFNLRGVPDLDAYLKNAQLPRKFFNQYTNEEKNIFPQWEEVRGLQGKELIPLKEAIKEEKERRKQIELSEDAYEETIVPYDDWAKFPNLWNKVDIPTSPRDRALYMGNTKQKFYDEFPEGHPDANTINKFLTMFNRTYADGVDESFASWAEEELHKTPMKPYVREWLKKLVYAIANNNDRAETYVENALKIIDRCWAKEYKHASAQESMKNPILALLVNEEKVWEELAKEGYNVRDSVKNFGKFLFRKFRGQMTGSKAIRTGYFWHRYRRVRNKYAPCIPIHNVDINRCNMDELQLALSIDRTEARKVWLARPFESLEETYSKGYIKGKSFANSESSDKIIQWMEELDNKAHNQEDLSKFTTMRKELFRMQRENDTKNGANLSVDQWSMVWRYYNILKERVMEIIDNKEK